MSQRLPLCAWCGQSLAHCERIVSTFNHAFKPTFGWHMNRICEKDSLFITIVKERSTHRGELLEQIEARGAGRVVRNGR